MRFKEGERVMVKGKPGVVVLLGPIFSLPGESLYRYLVKLDGLGEHCMAQEDDMEAA